MFLLVEKNVISEKKHSSDKNKFLRKKNNFEKITFLRNEFNQAKTKTALAQYTILAMDALLVTVAPLPI